MRRWLVPHDLTGASDEAALLAADELQMLGGGVLYLAHVDGGEPSARPRAEQEEATVVATLGLSDVSRRLFPAGASEQDADHLRALQRRLGRARVDVEVLRLKGAPCDALLTVVSDERVERIVLASASRSSVSRFFLGSVTDDIVHHSPVPVLVVKTGLAPTALEVPSLGMAVG